MGRLTQNTNGQPSVPTKNDPSSGPTMAAMPQMPLTQLSARGRSAGAVTSEMMMLPMGTSPPPPRPCRARKAIRDSMLQAQPHSREPSRNTSTLPMYNPAAAETVRHPPVDWRHDGLGQ